MNNYALIFAGAIAINYVPSSLPVLSTLILSLKSLPLVMNGGSFKMYSASNPNTRRLNRSVPVADVFSIPVMLILGG